MTRTILPLKRDEFIASMTPKKQDSFAKTFVRKCDMIGGWELPGAWAYMVDGQVAGAIVTSISKGQPRIANLQLLHTFHVHRGYGIGRNLVENAVDWSCRASSDYFRVSSEPDSIDFYQKLGFEFWGFQKSGTALSMFRIRTQEIKDGDYTMDSVIYNAVSPLASKRRGTVHRPSPMMESETSSFLTSEFAKTL